MRDLKNYSKNTTFRDLTDGGSTPLEKVIRDIDNELSKDKIEDRNLHLAIEAYRRILSSEEDKKKEMDVVLKGKGIRQLIKMTDMMSKSYSSALHILKILDRIDPNKDIER